MTHVVANVTDVPAFDAVASDGVQGVRVPAVGKSLHPSRVRPQGAHAFEYGHEPAASRILNTHPNLGISFDVTSVCRKDSLDMSDLDRDLLLDAICNILARWPQDSNHIRIVVTHGTDTMIKTAQYVQKRISDNAVIAFTGATKPERFVDSDASFNLGCAIAATSVRSAGAVVICMNGNVVPAGKCIRDEKSGLFIVHTESK